MFLCFFGLLLKERVRIYTILYAVVKIYNQLMEQTGEEVLDWRYTRHTDTFNDLLRLYANTRWTGNNGSYRFEELCDKI